LDRTFIQKNLSLNENGIKLTFNIEEAPYCDYRHSVPKMPDDWDSKLLEAEQKSETALRATYKHMLETQCGVNTTKIDLTTNHRRNRSSTPKFKVDEINAKLEQARKTGDYSILKD